MTTLVYPPGAAHVGARPKLQTVRVWQQSLEACPSCGSLLEIMHEERPGPGARELAKRCTVCGHSEQAADQQSLLEV